jgi:hypothetical protein
MVGVELVEDVHEENPYAGVARSCDEALVAWGSLPGCRWVSLPYLYASDRSNCVVSAEASSCLENLAGAQPAGEGLAHRSRCSCSSNKLPSCGLSEGHGHRYLTLLEHQLIKTLLRKYNQH